jgi:hypothetical protein
MPRHYLSPTGTLIIGATTHYAPLNLTIEDDGTPASVAGASLFWLYFDENGDEWTFQQLLPEEAGCLSLLTSRLYDDAENPPGGGEVNPSIEGEEEIAPLPTVVSDGVKAHVKKQLAKMPPVPAFLKRAAAE